MENIHPSFFQTTTFNPDINPDVKQTEHLFSPKISPCKTSGSFISRIGNQIETSFTKKFFGPSNINYLQNMLIKLIKKKGGYNIGKQSETELLLVMKRIYFDYGNDIDTNEEIFRLNELVVNYCVPRIILEIDAYFGYKKYIKGYRFLENPTSDSNTGMKINWSV